MKKPHYIAILAFSAVMFGIATTHEVHNSGNSPTQSTNAPGEGNCTSCHGGSGLNSGTGSVSISGLPAGGYTAGQVYAVTVAVNNTQTAANKRSGFSATALNSSNAKAGTLTATNTTTTGVNTGGARQYVGHKSATASVSSWTFNWTAPAAGTGVVTFYAVGNAANGSGTGGDQIYSTTATVSEFVAVQQPVATVSVSNVTLCEGESITVSGSATNTPASVSFNFGNGQSQTTAGPHTVTYNQAGNYTVTFNATNTGGTGTDTKNITVLAKPQPTISGNTQVCAGQTTNLSVPTANISSYSWSSGATASSITAGVGCVTVEVTGTNGCTATSPQFCVTAFAKSAAPAISPANPSICAGDSVQLIAASGYNNYVWSSGEFGPTFFANAAGKYSVSATDNNGCASDTASTILTVNPLPKPAIAGPSVFCAGSAATLSVSGGPYSAYTWSNSATTATISTTQGGTFTVSVTDAKGCKATSPTFTATAGNSLTPVINPAGTVTLCDGDSIIISAGQYTAYNWSNGAKTQTLVVKSSGNISVTVTDANGCSGTSAITTVVQKPRPVPTVTYNGSPNDILNATKGFVAYQWVIVNQVNAQNMPIDVTPIAGATADSVAALGGFLMAVEVTDANGCKGLSKAFLYVVSISEEVWMRGISLAPNPVQDKLSITFGANAPRTALISVLDMQGKYLHTATAEGETGASIATEGLAAGVYLVRIEAEGRAVMHKFVKQ